MHPISNVRHTIEPAVLSQIAELPQIRQAKALTF